MTEVTKRAGLSVAIVCAQAITRAAVAALLAADPAIGRVQSASGVDEIEDRCAAESFDVIVASAPTASMTLATVRRLHEGACPAPILVLALEATPALVRGTLRDGAAGILTVDPPPAELIDAIRAVAGGEAYVHPSLGAMLAQLEATREIEVLSPRERDVLRHIALGYTNPEIADRLVVSVRTVETHRAHLARKLGAETRAELVRHALDHGLINAG